MMNATTMTYHLPMNKRLEKSDGQRELSPFVPPELYRFYSEEFRISKTTILNRFDGGFREE